MLVENINCYVCEVQKKYVAFILFSAYWAVGIRVNMIKGNIEMDIKEMAIMITRTEYDQYTGCNRRKGPDFGRVFLMFNCTEKPQTTSIQSWTIWEVMTIENCGLLSGPRTIAVSWHSYLLVGLLAELQQAGVLRHHSTFQYDV
jgi:hypothetical protein